MKPPPGFKVDFFCIGAAKSGTTWLHHCLEEHPDISLSKSKEPNFFVKKLSAFSFQENPRFMQNWEWYAALFNDSGRYILRGEFSINLMHNIADAPHLILKYFPAAKFIVMLRDPVNRTYSHYWHEKRFDQVPGMPDTFEEGLQNQELLFRSRYYDQLKVWLDVFPRERFHFILDLDIKKDTLVVLQSLFGFLGVNPDFRPVAWDQRINAATKRHSLFYTSVGLMQWAREHRLGIVADVLKWSGINRLARRMLTRRAPYPPMSADSERWLRDYFLSDIEQLENLTGKNLDDWKA